MKVLADECCDADVVDALRRDGHDVTYVVESEPGATDAEVLRRARDDERILLTEDTDFGELVYRLQRPVYGLLLLRFKPEDRALKIPRLRVFLDREQERLPGCFVVLDPDKARVRPLP
jgi:uncharacterized protein with PIN domain